MLLFIKRWRRGDSEGARHVMHQHLSELRDEILAKMEAEGGRIKAAVMKESVSYILLQNSNRLSINERKQ